MIKVNGVIASTKLDQRPCDDPKNIDQDCEIALFHIGVLSRKKKTCDDFITIRSIDCYICLRTS